jgi:hypothetical protein
MDPLNQTPSEPFRFPLGYVGMTPFYEQEDLNNARQLAAERAARFWKEAKDNPVIYRDGDLTIEPPELPPVDDVVNQPKHYTRHPSGIECIQITEHMGFNLGNAVKYIWRCDLKKDAIEDLRKAVWYIEREIERRQSA